MTSLLKSGFFGNLRRRLLIYLAVFGPATITAISDNDAAGVATYSLAGANFGYSILFILLPVTILLAITQEMGARLAIVTGRGLADLIRERYGVVVSMLVFLSLTLANLGTIVANFSALKVSSSLLNIPTVPFVLLVIVAAFLMVFKGNYKTNQRIFLLGTILYVAYIFSAFKANPDWLEAIKGTFIPTNVQLSSQFVIASIAVLGTTITPWGQFFIQSYIVDKKLSVDKLRYSQIETFAGAFLTDFFSFFMIVATAATLFVHKIPLISGEQASLAIRPFAGELASLLLAVGLLNAALMGIVIVSLSTAYAFSEFFGYEGSLDASFYRGRSFYVLFLVQLIVAAMIILIPSVSLFKIVFYTQSLNGILLPILIYFLLNFTNNKNIMGVYINNRWFNYFAVIASFVIVAASLFTLLATIFKF